MTIQCNESDASNARQKNNAGNQKQIKKQKTICFRHRKITKLICLISM